MRVCPPYGRVSHGGKRLTLSSPHLNPQTLPWYVETLRQFADRFAPFNFRARALRPSYGMAEATVYIATREASR